MASYTQLGDVNTWWDSHGDGEPLVLLHPGGADSRAYDSNLDGLAAAFRTYRFDRRGQGRTPDVGGPITFAQMTNDAIAFIETVVGEPVHLIGHSIGAPVGLLVAQKRPDLVRGLVFSEGVFHFEGWLPGVLDPLPPTSMSSSAAYTPRSHPTAPSTGTTSGAASTTSITGHRR
jgi:pimeloyl-ACP methyl ester carboxylesterase